MKTLRLKLDQFHRLLAASLMMAVLASAGDLAEAAPGNPASWKTLAEGGAEVELVPDAQGTNTMRLTVKQTGRRSGIVCAGMGNMKLEPGQWYDLSFDARTGTRKTFALTVSLEGQNGKTVCARTTLPEVGGTNWMNCTVALHIRQPASKCRMVITLADTGTIWLDDLSVVLRKTAANH